jgi:hypothetical protein
MNGWLQTVAKLCSQRPLTALHMHLTTIVHPSTRSPRDVCNYRLAPCGRSAVAFMHRPPVARPRCRREPLRVARSAPSPLPPLKGAPCSLARCWCVP